MSSTSNTSAAPTNHDRARVTIGVLGALLHVGIGIFPLSASGLLAPLWSLIVIGLGWLAAAAIMWRIWQARPALALLVPPTTVALWAAFISVGSELLGWTA